MKTLITTIIITFLSQISNAQSPIGNWNVVSHESVYDGTKFDSQQALLSQRPCAAKVFYEITVDGIYRLNASQSGCDESYKKIQERLYCKTKWKVDGNKIMISATNFAVSQTYVFKIIGNKMIWEGTDGQGTITYQKL
jgi:Lipocalin-like domain